MHLCYPSQPEPAGLQHTAIPFSAVDSSDVNAATILSFLHGALGTAASTWLMPATRFARQVPPFSGNILEVHFGKEENSVDFATRLHAKFDKGLMAGVKAQHYQLPFVDSGLATLITKTEDGFIQGIKNIWVEFDAPFRKPPALFFDINRNELFCPQAVYHCLQQVTGVFHIELNVTLLRFLEQVKQAGLHVVYYGLMFSRNSPSVRLTINGIETEHLATALHQLGWKGNYQALKKLTATYLKKGQKLVVGVDVGNNIENRIGIEVFDEDKAAFIQALYHHHHISKTQYDLLTTWERSFILPDELRSVLTSIHQRPVSKLDTRINHFKFVVDATEKVDVKGYLYYCF